MLEQPDVENEKILIFRALKLGDMLCSIPALKALRKSYPKAFITLVSTPLMESLFDRYKHYVDEFIPFPGFPGMPEHSSRPEEIIKVFSEIQTRKFDLAVQLHGSGEVSNLVIDLFNAKQSAGFYREGGYCPASDLFQLYPEDEHEIHRCLSVLKMLDVSITEDHNLEFPLDERDFECLQSGLEREKIYLEQECYFCLHPGASTEDKRWSPSKFAKVGDYLSQKGYQVVFTGSGAESELVEKIIGMMTQKAFNLARLDLSLGTLAALIHGSAGMICNDTGVSHLSVALRIPSIVIFLTTDPKRWAPLNEGMHRWILRPEVDDLVEQVDQFLMGKKKHREEV